MTHYSEHFQYYWAEQIVRGAKIVDQRAGQYLFNHLPQPAAHVVSGKLFDPFHQEMDEMQVHCWIQDHLIFEGNRIIAVFNNNDILWEEPANAEVN